MEIYDEKEFKKKGLVCVQELQSVKQFNEMKDSEDVIFVFTADWCPDCRFIEPVLPEIEEQYPGYSFVEVNRDEFMGVAEEHDIFGIPSFLAFQDGKEAGRFVSKDRKTKDEIISFIDGLAK